MSSGETEPGSWSRPGRAALGTGAVAILLAGLLWTGSDVPDWRASAFLGALGVAGLLGAAASFLGRGARSREVRRGSAPSGRLSAGAATALLILLAILFASSSLSAHPALSFRRLGGWVCLAGWAHLIARRAGSSLDLKRGMVWMAAAGAAGSVASLADSFQRRWSPPHLPFDNPNHDGALAAVSGLLLITLAAQESRRSLRVSLALLAALAGAAVLASESTAALFALAAGLATAAAAWAGAKVGLRQDQLAGALGAVIAITALLVPVAMGASRLAERSGTYGVARTSGPEIGLEGKSFSTHWWRLKALMAGRPDVSLAARLRYGRATLGALREEPLLGFGLGAVPLTFARYRLQVPGATPWGEAVGQLHSVGLQRLYEGGAAGLAAFAAWLLLSLLGRSPEDPLRVRLRAGLAAAVAALAVAGAADALETAPALGAAGVVLLALLASRQEARATERLPAWFLRGIGGVCGALAFVVGADLLRADLAQKRAEEAVERARASGFDEEVVQGLRSSARLDGALGLYEHQAAYATEELALDRIEAGDPEAGQRLFDEAERLYRRAAQRCPDVPGFSSQAGNFLLDRDRPREAIPFLARGAALDYYDPLGHFYLGEAYRLSGSEREAVEAYARSLRFFPRMADAVLWSAPENRALYRRVLERLRGMLLEESARHVPGSAPARLLAFVEERLSAPPPHPAKRVILVHHFDLAPGTSRSRHLFNRRGFTIENLPVTVLEPGAAGDESRWARVLEGLPPLTAAALEAEKTPQGGRLRSLRETGGSRERHREVARVSWPMR